MDKRLKDSRDTQRELLELAEYLYEEVDKDGFVRISATEVAFKINSCLYERI